MTTAGLAGAAEQEAPRSGTPGGEPTGVLLMTFGSAVTADDVPGYLASVRRGRQPSQEVVTEFRRRYALIGRSPLIDITRAQAAALQAVLDARFRPGRYRVGVGMLHSRPAIEEAVAELASVTGLSRLIGIVLAPQFSPIIMAGYSRALEAAAGSGSALEVSLAGPWHRVGGFIDCLSECLAQALERLAADRRSSVPVIFTAHSLPRSVVDRDPGYIEQILETVEAVADRAGLAPERRQFAYQSAGHTPEEWLKPDFRDLLPGLRKAGHREVLVVPTQFLSDHLEILYDIDIAGREEAEEQGIAFHRIHMPNTSPSLIDALAEVVGREDHPP
ncbi:MAG: ferrochelatase [Candidatus Dormibacteria bacterium]